MNCNEIQDLMLEAESQETVDEAVRKHLIGCAHCRAAWRDYEDVLSSLREMEALQPSEGFTERIVARLAEQRTFRRQLAFALAAVVAVAAGGWFFAATLEGWMGLATAKVGLWSETWLVFDLEAFMPTSLFGTRVLGLPLWQLAAALGALGLGWVVTEALDFLPQHERRR